MNATFSIDPSYALAKVFIRIAMVFCALMIAIMGYMIYLAYLGIIDDWDLWLQFPLFEFYPESNSTVWHMIFFSFPAVGFLIAFFLLGWLHKKIQKEGKTQHLVA